MLQDSSCSPPISADGARTTRHNNKGLCMYVCTLNLDFSSKSFFLLRCIFLNRRNARWYWLSFYLKKYIFSAVSQFSFKRNCCLGVHMEFSSRYQGERKISNSWFYEKSNDSLHPKVGKWTENRLTSRI